MRLGRLSLLKRFGPGMMDSFKLSDVLYMKDDAFAGTSVDQKTGKQLELA